MTVLIAIAAVIGAANVIAVTIAALLVIAESRRKPKPIYVDHIGNVIEFPAA